MQNVLDVCAQCLQLPLPPVGTRRPEYETVHSEYGGRRHQVRGGAVVNLTKNGLSNAKVCRGRVFVRVHMVVMKEPPFGASTLFFIFLPSTPNFHFPNSSGCCDLWRAPWNEAGQESVQPSNKSPIGSPVRGRCDILRGESIAAWRRFEFSRA